MNKSYKECEFILENETATWALASQIANLAKPTDIITLAGDLGVGKTSFARGLIGAIGGDCEVPSPTFTLVQSYEFSNIVVYHFDLYRIMDPEEILELGIEDAYSEGLSLIEWPERMAHYLPSVRLEIKIWNGSNKNSRNIKIVAHGDNWIQRLTQLNI